MGAGSRRLATGELGGISRCCPPRQKDATAGAATQSAVVHLRARSSWAATPPADHLRGVVYLSCRGDLQDQEGGLRLRGGGRGARYQRRPCSVLRGSGKRSTQCPIF